MNPFIITFTGLRVNPLELTPEQVNIEDIAHALACCNRFAGHARVPISVAQHSVFASRLCKTKEAKKQALLHDASEAYIGDVTKWVKATDAFAGYREVEERIQRTIYESFGCPTEQLQEVSNADKLMLRFEGYKAFGTPRWLQHLKELRIAGRDYQNLEPEEKELVGPWGAWTWRQAEEGFLLQYRLLV